MSKAPLTKEQKFNNVLDVLVSLAACPILIGALFKITHAPGADVWLKIGLWTEAGVFFVYALQAWLFPANHSSAHAEGAAAVNTVVAQPVIQQPELKVKFSDLGLSDDQIGKLKGDFMQLGSSIEQFGKNIGDFKSLSETMVSSATDAKKTQDELAAMAANLNKLNQVYGNMLSAMSGNRQ